MTSSAAPSPEALAALETRLLALLAARPAGISEHELLNILRQQDACFAAFSARDPLSLFRGHYLLFHALYRLRDRLAREQRGRLVVDPLCIVLQGRDGKDGAESAALDPAAPDWGFWYADGSRLTTVSAAEVVELLRQRHTAHRHSERRLAALAVLELREPADAAAIKRQYRRLAMRHHPDRGGDGQRLREIHAALAVLEGRS